MDRRKDVEDALLRDAVAEGGNAFRRRAIQACAGVVKTAPEFCDAESAKVALLGKVSDRMMKRVIEILDADTAGTDDARARTVQELMTVTCIGHVAATRLVTKGVTSLDDLASRMDDPDLSLTAAQKLCMRYRDDIAQRIPRGEMIQHAAALEECARSSGCEAHVVGSYRRNCESSGDIDVLIIGDLDGFLSPLVQSGYIVGTIAHGSHKFNGLVRLRGGERARRLDVLKTCPEELPFALLHFTGPGVYNVALRKVAMAAGKRLSEKGWNDAAAPRPASEADILRALGVEYQVPQDRCGTLPLMAARP
jgi:DNA polymerase lambda